MKGTPWKLTAAQIQGYSHKRSGLPCQDRTLCMEGNKTRVIALADGAGSARLSQYGAEAVVQAVAEYLIDSFDEIFLFSERGLKHAISEVIRKRLDLLSREHSCDIKDLSSTLLLVVVKKNRYLALHIGDGVIGCMNRKRLQVVSQPKNGEFTNLTWFTTSTNLEDVLRVYRGDAARISGFILMSDGVEPSLYDTKKSRLAPAVLNLFYVNAKSNPQDMHEMLKDSLANVIALRTRDDCSIAVMSRSRFKKYGEYSRDQRKIAKDRATNVGVSAR